MAYFQENEQILYLSTDLLEKQMIEDGINRKLTVIRTIEGLVEEIEGSMIRQGRVTVIVTKQMSELFKRGLTHLVETFAAMDSNVMQVIEIGIGETFERAMTFVDVLSFVEYVRREKRLEYIEEVEESGTDEAEEEGRVLRELLVEIDSVRERVATYERLVEDKEQELIRTQAELQKLKTKIDHVYEVERKNKANELEEAHEELKELNRLMSIEKEKVKDYERELGEYRSINKGLELDKKSLTELNEDRKREKRALEGEIRTHKRHIEKLQQEKAEMSLSRVDGEEHYRLVTELEKEREEKKELQKEMVALQVDNRKKEFNISGLLDDIDELRRGEEDLQTYGRTQKLDEYRFESLNLVYIKIVHDLPYLTSALREMKTLLKEQFPGRLLTAIIRNDEGLDGVVYENLQLYGTLGDVRTDEDTFLLHPTRRMFTGADKFERSVGTLVVLDYIRSPEYYLETNGLSHYITVVKDSSMIKHYGLRGTPVSLDLSSKLDIKHDTRFDHSDHPNTRKGYVKKKVEDWLYRIGLITQ